MGSSFTVVNDAGVDMWVKSDIHWEVLWGALTAIFAVVLALATFGVGAAVGGINAAPAVSYIMFNGMTVSLPAKTTGAMLYVLLSWKGIGAVVGGAVLGAGGIAGIVESNKAMIRAQADTPEIRDALLKQKDDVEKMLKGFTHVKPGQQFKFSKTLSLLQKVTVIYNDFSVASADCWTGPTDKSNNEYKVSQHFRTATFVGCYKDSEDRVMTNKWDIPWYDHDKHYWCLKHCKGYEFYGLENGSECWCSNDVKFLTRDMVKEAECNKHGKHRGFNWRMAVHKITPSPLCTKSNDCMQEKDRRRISSGDDTLPLTVFPLADNSGDPQPEWEHMLNWLADSATDPIKTCNSKPVQKCEKCLDCVDCLFDWRDNTPKCNACREFHCDECANTVPCLAVKRKCADRKEMAEAFGCLGCHKCDDEDLEECNSDAPCDICKVNDMFEPILQCLIDEAEQAKLKRSIERSLRRKEL